MRDEEYKNALYRELAKLAILDKDLFMDAIKDFEISELLRNGVHVGFLMEKANEIHLHITPEKAVKYAVWVIRRVITPLLTRYGELITFSLCPNDKLLLRMGFVNVGLVGQLNKFMLKKIKLKKCRI